MGRKGIIATSSLTVVAIVLNAIGASQPTHIMSFFSLIGLRIFRGKTYLLSWKLDDKSNDFCRVLPQSVCGNDIHEVHELQDISQRFCSTAATQFFPSICDGLSRAYVTGMAMVIVMVVNAVMLLIANYMLWDYINGAKKQSYRVNAQILMGWAVVLQCFLQVFYGAFVLMPLDQGGNSNPIFSAVMSPSKNTGVSSGYLLMGTSVLVQFVMLAVVSTQARTSSELDAGDIEDRKERAELLAEQQKMFANGSSGGGYGGAPAPGYGAAPAQAMVYGQAPVLMSTQVVMGSDLPPQGFMPPLGQSSQPSAPGPMTPSF